MHNFHPAHTATASPASDPFARLNWLTRWNEESERHALLFRDARAEERRVRLMRRPIPTRAAFALFGLLLGGIVPAAIFYRMFGYGMMPGGASFKILLFPLLVLAMNIVCCLMGWKMGAVFGSRIDDYERASWHRMVLRAMCVGALWGLTTGAAGGVLFFGFGALFGAFIALPVGALGFLLFTPLHRLMARGGMIDARHFWPLASGVVFVIAAMILGSNP